MSFNDIRIINKILQGAHCSDEHTNPDDYNGSSSYANATEDNVWRKAVHTEDYNGGYGEGVHLFPFRTEKLRPSALMVLP